MENDHQKKRANNWNKEERDLLLELMKTSVKVLENKDTHSNTNKVKIEQWQNLARRFNQVTVYSKRDVGQLKGQWRRMKLAAKKQIGQYKRARIATGGGSEPPAPSNEAEVILALIPNEFEVDVNHFDSDSANKEETTIHLDNKMKEDEINLCIIDESEATQEVCETTIVFDNDNNCDIMSEVEECRNDFSSTPKINKQRIKHKERTSYAKSITNANLTMKHRATQLMEEEWALKKQLMMELHEHKKNIHKMELKHQEEKNFLELEYLKRELEHQKLKHEITLKKFNQ